MSSMHIEIIKFWKFIINDSKLINWIIIQIYIENICYSFRIWNYAWVIFIKYHINVDEFCTKLPQYARFCQNLLKILDCIIFDVF